MLAGLQVLTWQIVLTVHAGLALMSSLSRALERLTRSSVAGASERNHRNAIPRGRWPATGPIRAWHLQTLAGPGMSG